MPVDSNIFQQYLQPPKSVIDYQNEYAKTDQLNNQNALQALTLQQQTAATAQSLAERNALQRIAAGSGGDRQALITGMRNSGLPGLMTQADSLEQSGAKLQESQALAAKNNADAGKTTQETQIAGHAQHLQKLSTVNSPQDAVQWMIDGVRSGALPAAGLPSALDRLQQASADPNAFAQWKQQTAQSGQTVQQQIEMTAAKPTEMRLGNVVKTIDMNPRSATFGKEVVGQQQVGVSPDTAANNATSRANNAANIGKDLQVAGIAPGGGVDDNSERTAQAIASGQLPAPTGMALLNPRNQRILGRVMEINPQYDATTVSAKKAAATAFTSGPLGNALRSVSTANAHLDQLGQLADALNNGNTQVVNKVQNYFSQQTGSPDVTNFDAVKNIVGQEVVKAIVAGGGSSGERDEAAKIFSNASSPAQLKGAIQHYRMVMGAQANNLMEQRRAAGLPDSTLPNYSNTNTTAAIPPDIAAILQKHGGK